MILERLIVPLLQAATDGLHRNRSDTTAKRAPGSALTLGASPLLFRPNQTERLLLSAEERGKHLYVCGGSGMGKSNLLYNLLKQDILQRNGFGIIDAHGDLINQILNFITTLHSSGALTERDLNRIILIDPGQSDYVVAFNPLQANKEGSSYSQVSEMMSVFRKIWKDVSWGARMDELLRATLYTLSEKGLTLLEARPLLTNPDYRRQMTQDLKNPEIRDYWHDRFDPLSDKMQAVYREPVLNKISIFLSDPDIRLMLGQKKGSVNFRKAMDEGKWVLINLSKGKLKENTFLLGGLFVLKLYHAALSRAELPPESRRPFYLYIDEFQNFAGDGFVDILSESRKYGLSLSLANQNLAQLDRSLLSSIFANASTHIYFRLSPQDVGAVSAEFDDREEGVMRSALVDLKVGQAVLRRKGQATRLLRTFYEAQRCPDKAAFAKVLKRALQNSSIPKDKAIANITDARKTSSTVAVVNRQLKAAQSVVIQALPKAPAPCSPTETLEEGE